MTALNSSKIVGVIGAGTMGAGIAQIAATHGHQVMLLDQEMAAIEKGLSLMASGLNRQIKKGKMTQEEVDALLLRITPCTEQKQLQSCDLIIEAIVENLEVKQSLFKSLESLCSSSTIFATNTSSISVTAIASVLDRPENLVGMHFFNPAPVMKLVEIISGLATSQETINTITATAANWGKTTVNAKSTPGFIVNRIARPFYAESLRILEEGAASEATLDVIVRESAGFRMGPFELMDLIGHDVNYSVTESVFNSFYQDKRFLPSLIQKELVAGGFLGRKSGKGFYEYGDNAEKPPFNNAHHEYRPDSITVQGDLGIASPLITLAETAGIQVDLQSGLENGLITCGEVTLALTDGRTATRRAKTDNISNLVVFDLLNDFQNNTRIAISPALQTSEEALNHAIGFLNRIGKEVSLLTDVPGLCVMRTVCMLANEGADAVYQGVCDIEAVDNAMRYGLNYPKGPMAWADEIGLTHVNEVLANLAITYGIDRYRTSVLLQQYSDAGRPLYD